MVVVAPTVIYASMLGVTIFALVDAVCKPKHQQTVFLIGLLVLLLIHILGELLIYTGAYRYLPALAGMQLPLRVLLGPALYFYAHATMSVDRHLPTRAYLFAATGPVMVLVAMAPFIFGLSSAEKLALADPLTRNPEHFKLAVLACTSAMVIFVLFTFGYLTAALKLHQQHRVQLMQRFAAIEAQSLDWFRVVLLLWGCTWFLFALEYITVFLELRWVGSGVVLPLLEAMVLLAFAYLALNQSVLTDSDRGVPQNTTPRVAALSHERMAFIAEKLNTVMTEDELFMDENLSLNKLSQAVSVSENHISETLSQHLTTNFYHFVNGFRIEAAKMRLKNSTDSVAVISYDVGFNSKSTFNTAFKKASGMTPSAFRK